MAKTDFTFTSDFSPEQKAKVMTSYFRGQVIKAVATAAGIVLGLLIVNGNIGGKNNVEK